MDAHPRAPLRAGSSASRSAREAGARAGLEPRAAEVPQILLESADPRRMHGDRAPGKLRGGGYGLGLQCGRHGHDCGGRPYCVRVWGLPARSGGHLGTHGRVFCVPAPWAFGVRCVSGAGTQRARRAGSTRSPRSSAAPAPADVGRPCAWAPAREARAASGRAAEGGGERSSPGAPGPAPASRPAHLGRRPTCRALGAGPGAWPWRARWSPAEGGRRLIPGIPRAPALASAAEPALGARRPRVRVGVRSGGGLCGARARRRLRVGAPAECARPRAPRGRAPASAPSGAWLARGGRAGSRPAVSAGEPGRVRAGLRGAQGWADLERDGGVLLEGRGGLFLRGASSLPEGEL